MAEFLIFAGDEAPLYLEKLRDNSVFRVGPFDERAAIELAHVELTSRKRGNKRGTTDGAAWQKVKFDRQIVAVAKANGASCIYSIDPDVVKYAAEFGIEAKTISDLPKPPAVQESLAFQSEGQDATGTDQKEVAPPPVGPREAATEILKIPPQPKPPGAKRKTNKMKEKTPGQKEG